MEKISNIEELNIAIKALETKQAANFLNITEDLILLQNELSPTNLIKSIVKNLMTFSELKNGLIDVTLGLGAGYLTKKVIGGGSQNKIQKLLAFVTESFVSTEVATHGDRLRSMVSSLFKKS